MISQGMGMVELNSRYPHPPLDAGVETVTFANITDLHRMTPDQKWRRGFPFPPLRFNCAVLTRGEGGSFHSARIASANTLPTSPKPSMS